MTAPSLPPINFAKLQPLDMDRVGRAMGYTCRRIGDGQYEVVKPIDPLNDPKHVDLYSNDVPRCDCADFTYNGEGKGVLCKHIICCLIAESHPVAINAIVDWIKAKR